MTRYARHYRKVSRSLSRLELMRTAMDDDWGDPRRLVEDPPRRFLDFYGDEGIRLGFERYGLLDALQRRGYGDFEVHTRTPDDRHTLILSGSHRKLAEPTHLLELVVRRDRLVPDAATGLRPFGVLTVDWLSLRNPVREFTAQRPRLPGQDAPGSGIGERVLELLYRVVDRLKLGGMLTVAEYFHNAVLYRRELPFFDPSEDGKLAALQDALLEREGLTLAQASWAVEWGCVSDGGAPFEWRGEAQIRAMHDPLLAYLRSQAYRTEAELARKASSYALDREAFDTRWSVEEGALIGPSDELSRSGRLEVSPSDE